MPSKNTFSLVDNEIYIMREGWKRNAITTYREDYYEELTSVTWSEKNGYLFNSKLGYLHRYIMQKWYGKEVFSRMTAHSWVIDHMNGVKFDCRISNLEFLSINYNVAKGQTVDIDSEKLRMHLALTICKDFSTGYYQIHLGCNDDLSLYSMVQNRFLFRVAELHFLYNCDYRIVINEAISILLNYKLMKRINISSLQFVDWKADPAIPINLSEEEKNQAVIIRGGKVYGAIGNGFWFHSHTVEKGWLPPE